MSDKIDFNTKTVIRNKEGHYLMIKGSIQEEDITSVNIHAPNRGAPKYIKHVLTDIKGDIDCNRIIVGDFNAPLTSVDRSTSKNISKEILALNDILDQMNLIYVEHSIQK